MKMKHECFPGRKEAALMKWLSNTEVTAKNPDRAKS
jgi:hypothetical protein